LALSKENLICSKKFRTHLCICNQCKDIGSSACVQRLYGYRIFNSMKILIIVFEFAMYSLELEIKFKMK
jgi:hypothetical protein